VSFVDGTVWWCLEGGWLGEAASANLSCTKLTLGEVNLGKIESGSRYAGIYYVYDLTLESN
jgi:hypothetical protein